ncbi:unnamed protein product [Clonostachys rosea]|uniref:Uncharacterized protein n=1 Tax=Bionectria ochroleuca TaxID=29856 RepID=A0ABY6UYW7_BIOOC|nr:unnamed protein product [Clonostachys rosea]
MAFNFTICCIQVRVGEQLTVNCDRHEKLQTLMASQSERIKAYITQQLAVTAAIRADDMVLLQLHPQVKEAQQRPARHSKGDERHIAQLMSLVPNQEALETGNKEKTIEIARALARGGLFIEDAALTDNHLHSSASYHQ